MADLLQITHEPHGILRLTLNDPARRNALSEAMLDHLWDAIQLASDDASVRAVIIAANGPAFCAGHDLKELTAGRANDDKGKAYFTKIMTRCSSVMQAILQTPKPVIAEITATPISRSFVSFPHGRSPHYTLRVFTYTTCNVLGLCKRLIALHYY